MKELVHKDFVLPGFHSPPEGMYYEFLPFKNNVIAIWILYKRRFHYNSGDQVRCIWGFYNKKTRTYYSPINSSKVGKEVRIEDTTPYTSMPLNLNPLMQCLMSPS
jgi:hypothetical protein